MQAIADIAAKLDVPGELLLTYGRDKAKIDRAVLDGPARSDAPRLVLVSAITPTPSGEGKTTTSIGLGDALAATGKRVCLALREPSLGPCMGMKGGGTGGGRAQVVPSDDINLHFNGDFHAITSAHNLLAATLDNHAHFRLETGIEPRRVLWRRAMDMNDRALREIVSGLGGKTHGIPRQTGFDITAASELMAMLCLADDAEDLRVRIDRTLVAFDRGGEPLLAEKLGVTGAMLALLRDALHPNLVQTREGTPAILHGGPFANIAHGCNSVLATRSALHLADWVVTEAGFGFDLGAEKFFHIKCRSAGIDADVVVLVATVRALKMHGGVELSELESSDPAAVERGLQNLEKHVESIRRLGKAPVIGLNRFASDSDDEIAVVRRACEAADLPFAEASHFADGGPGAIELAEAVTHAAGATTPFRPLYELSDSVPDKIRAVARGMYGAEDVAFTKDAERELAVVDRLGYAGLPICIAKTQNSLSDNPALRGRPRDFDLTVRSVQINAGAGFLVVLTGDIMRMPGLSRHPQAERIDLINGQITGLS